MDLVSFGIKQRLSELQHTPDFFHSRADRKESEQQLVNNLTTAFPEDRPRQFNEWMKRTGKSGRAYYRRLQEIEFAQTSMSSPSPKDSIMANCQRVATHADGDRIATV